VGEDYFCETGNRILDTQTFPLCEGGWECMLYLQYYIIIATPPWFYKQLPQPNTDDIEMRVHVHV
jgi:hypothetical protein